MVIRNMTRLMFVGILLVSSAAMADVVSSSGYAPYWQNIPVSARAVGMGGAHIGVLEGPEAARWSPAVPPQGNGVSVSWNRVSEREFMPLNRWAGAVSVEHGGMRLSVIRDRVANGPYPDHQVYLPGNSTSSTIYETTDLVSLSGDITSLMYPNQSHLLTFGVGLRRTQIERRSPSDVFIGLDFGLTARQSHVSADGQSTTFWQFGAALMNGVRPMVDDAMSPESNLRLGGAGGIGAGSGLFGGHAFSLLMAYDWTNVNSEWNTGDRQWEQRLGFESMLWNVVALRIGVVDRGTHLLIGNKTWGVGVVVEDPGARFRLRVDYGQETVAETWAWDEEVVERVGVSFEMMR